AAAAARNAQEAAPRLGGEVLARSVRTAEELANTLKGIAHPDGLLAPFDTILDIPGQMLVASLWARLPVIYPVALWARGAAPPGVPESGLGALAAYGRTTNRRPYKPHAWWRRCCVVQCPEIFPSKASPKCVSSSTLGPRRHSA